MDVDVEVQGQVRSQRAGRIVPVPMLFAFSSEDGRRRKRCLPLKYQYLTVECTVLQATHSHESLAVLNI
jgi:hypothetical protein